MLVHAYSFFSNLLMKRIIKMPEIRDIEQPS